MIVKNSMAQQAQEVHQDIVSGGAISRQIARPHNTVFHGIFTESNLTKIQKIKQFIQCIVWESGTRVARMQRMAEQQLHQEMNKAYYQRLQVLYADIADDRSYWKRHLGFNFTFADMMTHTFGSSQVQRAFFFDYTSEDLEDAQVENLKLGWTNGYLWRKYGELKTELQGSMLPVLFKCKIHALDGGESYSCGSGNTFAEVFYEFLGRLFQINANALHEDRVRKRQRASAAAAAPAVVGEQIVLPAGDQVEENDDSAAAPQAAAAAAPAVSAAPAAARSNIRDAPDRWGDAHVAWRHASLFTFVLYGPLAYFHPDRGSKKVDEFLRKVPRSGPPSAGAQARAVEQGDSRRRQRRREGRESDIEQVDDDNRSFIEQLAFSRQSQDRAAQESNELARLQLQVQIAAMQRQQPSGLEHVQGLLAAIEMLNKMPAGIVLSNEQLQQKKDMESRYADAVLALGRVQHDPFSSILSELAAPRPVPAETVPRFHSASAGGGGNRGARALVNPRNLQTNFRGSVNGGPAAGAEPESD
jgi:hypothetical protein